jgi:hypothetical protein
LFADVSRQLNPVLGEHELGEPAAVESTGVRAAIPIRRALQGQRRAKQFGNVELDGSRSGPPVVGNWKGPGHRSGCRTGRGQSGKGNRPKNSPIYHTTNRLDLSVCSPRVSIFFLTAGLRGICGVTILTPSHPVGHNFKTGRVSVANGTRPHVHMAT